MSLARSLLPKSLFGRNLLLFIILIFIAEVGNGILFRQLVQEPRAARMAEVARLQIETVRAALLLVPPDKRADLLNSLLAGEDKRDANGIAISRVTSGNEQPALLVEPNRIAINLFVRRLRQTLGPQYQVGWQDEPERRLWVATHIDNVSYWFGIDAGVFVSNTTTLFVVISLGAALLAVLGAMAIQRRINRPLNALAAAAAEIGRGRIELIPTNELTSEIAAVAHSFNHMAQQLEAAERERALMLAGVSHDLRTPLAKLRLAVAIMADDNEVELIEGMVRNIAAADAIIGQFIDFARLGSDEPQSLCDINEIASDVAGTVEPSRIETRFITLPSLTCHPLALRRAISNLVENALRYGSDASGTPVLLLTSMEHGHIRISLADCGPGIAPEQMERLRQPFTRADEARSKTTGSGLGLAIVERIARQHRGRLMLANRARGGLEASILLPIVGEDTLT